MSAVDLVFLNGKWALCVGDKPIDDQRWEPTDHRTAESEWLKWQRDLAEINAQDRAMARRSA